MDMLELVQWRATMLVRGLEHGMREGTGFVQAGEGLGDLTAVCKYLVGWCRENAGSWWQGQRQGRQVGIWKIQNSDEEKNFYLEDDQVQWEAARKEVESPSLEGLSTCLEMTLGSLAQLDLLWAGTGPGDVPKSFQTCMILFYLWLSWTICI